MADRLKVDLAVLNWNGRALLEKYLPSVVREAKASRHDCRTVVVDNASEDGSEAFVRDRFPEAHFWRAQKNKVLCSYNDYVLRSDADVVVLLNNDLELLPGWVDPMIEPFLRDPDVFFTASRGNRSRAVWRNGILTASFDYPGYDRALGEPGFTLSAGCPAVDRKKFLELGGFDEVYLPGVYEDVDLCWRAWKRGWKGVYVPQSDQVHEGETSFKKRFSAAKRRAMVFRNSVLFMWKNIQDPWLRLRFNVLLGMNLLTFPLGRFFVLSGFLGASWRWPRAARSRRKAKKLFRLSDVEVFDRMNEAFHA